MIVLDSSAAVEYLAGRTYAEWVEARIEEDGDVHVPHVLDVEVANAFRNLVARKELDSTRAREGLLDLARLDVSRHPHILLLQAAWRLGGNLSAYDAVYVALAAFLDAPLVTTDLRLARAPVPVAIVSP